MVRGVPTGTPGPESRYPTHNSYRGQALIMVRSEGPHHSRAATAARPYIGTCRGGPPRLPALIVYECRGGVYPLPGGLKVQLPYRQLSLGESMIVQPWLGTVR